jgi:hypothetical protein
VVDSGFDAGIDSGPFFDAGPPAPTAGSPCTKVGELVTTYCGFCGTRESVCEGTKVWSAPGPCQGSVPGGCTPFSSRTATCGNCGSAPEVCTTTCKYVQGACIEPAGACAPGTVEFTSAGCPTADEYKSRSCDATCKFPAFSATCGPRKLTIAGTVGASVRTDVVLDAAKTMKKLDEFTTCPSAQFGIGLVSFVYLVVENTTAKAATVTAYNRPAAGGGELDTMIWTYNGTTPPTTDAQIKACAKGVADECTGTLASNICGNTMEIYNLAALEGITIPAGGKILVYVSGYDSTVLGKVTLVIRTDSLI